MTRSTTRHFAPILLLLSLALILPIVAYSGSVEETAYGTELTAAKKVPIKKLLARPEAYVGKAVRVAGVIEDVCPKMGCWIDIAKRPLGPTVRFKVDDGVIEFPTEVKGKSVVAEGTFTRIDLTEEQALAWAKHVAEETGKSFDPETAEISTTIYRIDGKGAVVR